MWFLVVGYCQGECGGCVIYVYRVDIEVGSVEFDIFDGGWIIIIAD